MNNPKAIQVGDLVEIRFMNGDEIYGATILRVPSDVGDSWSVETMDHRIYNIQFYERMLLLEKGKEPK